MTRRFPSLIARSISAELLRLLALTGLCLVTVISFAAAIKPLADGQIGLAEAVRFMALAVVPMLQFALPFAAGFAATITYHRFAADNEATAAMAGGISHRALLAPAAIIGLALALLIAFLMNFSIPNFLHDMERVIARNAADALVSSIERGQSISIGEWDLHAESALSFTPDDTDDDAGPYEVVLLDNVFASQMDQAGNAAVFISARRVRALLYEDPGAGEGATVVQLVFDDPLIVQDDESGTRREIIETDRTFTQPIRIPGAFSDDPKFRTMGELARLKENPAELRGIAQLRRRLASRLAEHFTIEEIDQRLAVAGRARLEDGAGGSILLRAASLQPAGEHAWRLVPEQPDQPIVIRWTRPGGAETNHLAESATLELLTGENRPGAQWWTPARKGVVRLVARRVATVTPDDPEPTADRESLAFPALSTPTDYFDAERKRPVRDILERARAIAEQGSPVAERIRRAASTLQEETDDALREVVSKQHERAAFSSSCLLMVLIGAVVGFAMRDALPLPVYLWSFLPALVAVITMSSGQRLTHRIGTPGLLLLWGGVGALALLCLALFARLRRH